jgi:hypothetical protein
VVERQNPSAGEFQDLVKRERAPTHKKIRPRDGKLSMSAEFENAENGKWIYGHIFTQLLINTSIKDCASVNSADPRHNNDKSRQP